MVNYNENSNLRICIMGNECEFVIVMEELTIDMTTECILNDER